MVHKETFNNKHHIKSNQMMFVWSFTYTYNLYVHLDSSVYTGFHCFNTKQIAATLTALMTRDQSTDVRVLIISV